MFFTRAAIAVSMLFTMVSSYAADLVVPTSQFPTIRSAMSYAQNGDTIILLPGTYTGQDNCNLQIDPSKSFTLQSTLPHDPQVAEATVIDAGSWQPGSPIFQFNNVSSAVLIDGITFLGSASSYLGGIAFCYNSSPTFRNCNFELGYSETGGAVDIAYKSSPTFINCTFIDNSGRRGGAIYAEMSKLTLRNCKFYNNFAEEQGSALVLFESSALVSGCRFINNLVSSYSCCQDGGAISALNNSTLTCESSEFIGNHTPGMGGAFSAGRVLVDNCKFIGNSSGNQGGAVVVSDGSRFKNCLFAGNFSGGDGSAIFCGASINSLVLTNCTITMNRTQYWGSCIAMPNSVTLSNSIFFDNEPNGYWNFPNYRATYSNLGFEPNQPKGVGNISADPMFVNPGAWDGNDFIPGDYHLMPDSPCINKASPSYVASEGETDADGRPRVILGRLDMGCFESAPNPRDINQDGYVNTKDFAEFSADWLWKAPWVR